jgi:hypothetical protein
MTLPWIASDCAAGRHARRIEGLAAHIAGREPPKMAEHYARASVCEIALEMLQESGRAHGLRAGQDNASIVRLALGTGDLQSLLGDVGQIVVLEAYSAFATTASRICGEPIELSNFRPYAVARLDALPGLLQVNEHGEVKLGVVDGSAETMQLATYAARVPLTRQALVNDSTGALRALFATAGQRARAFVNDLLFATCLAPNNGLGPGLADGAPVFDAALHANVVGAGGFDATRLSEARALLKRQVVAGTKLNTPLRYLLVAPDRAQVAEELIAKTAPALNGPDAEPIAVLSDANLGTGTRFYGLADPSVGSNFRIGTLQGRDGPMTLAVENFKTGGIDVRILLDVALAPVEWRFDVTGAGV